MFWKNKKGKEKSLIEIREEIEAIKMKLKTYLDSLI